MKKRLYFMLPNVQSAREVLDELLLARIEERHIHFLARRDTLPPDLPEASYLQKSDLVHGAEVGLVVGGSIGTAAGIIAVLMPPAGIPLQLVTVLICAMLGAVFGVWVSGMIGSQIPNSRLKAFQADIARGNVLMMVDVPFTRVAAVRDRVMQKHPEAVSGGIEPTIPAFP